MPSEAGASHCSFAGGDLCIMRCILRQCGVGNLWGSGCNFMRKTDSMCVRRTMSRSGVFQLYHIHVYMYTCIRRLEQ